MIKRGKLEQSSRDHIFCKQKIGNKAQGLSLTTIIIAVIVIVVLVVLVYIFTGGAGRFSKDVEERGRKICFLQDGRCVKADECKSPNIEIGDYKEYPECGEGNVCCEIKSKNSTQQN